MDCQVKLRVTKSQNSPITAWMMMLPRAGDVTKALNHGIQRVVVGKGARLISSKQ
ncbi:hypothetical protein JCM19233_5400 [Vibrio astriarenae]|nr:hypothetical protein JCM19233_5400 [Vibrio sp. C7]